ncbi:MAG: prepilin peptidase [Acutalibacteraceae bacterium]
MGFLTAYIAVIIFVFGTVIGSFLNVLIYRLPIGMDFKKGNSICTSCKHKLNWKDLFPLFSWIFLGGKCRYCKAPISPRYPIVEALNGTAYVLIYLFIAGGTAIEGLNLKLVGYMIMMSALIVVSWIDFEHQIIPDSMWIAIFVGGLFIVADTLITGTFTKEWIISKLIGLVAVSGVFFIIAFVTQGRAMGGGDIKLMAAVGFVLGWKAVIVALFMSAIFGVLFALGRKIFSKKAMKGVVPFGPFLAMGSAVCAFVGENIFNGYLNLFL